MDPLTRLTLFLWQFSRRRHSHKEVIFYAFIVLGALAIGFIDWAGYWPDSWRVERSGMPKVIRQ